MGARPLSLRQADEQLDRPGGGAVDQRGGQEADEQEGDQLPQDGVCVAHDAHGGRQEEESHIRRQKAAEPLDVFRLEDLCKQQQSQQQSQPVSYVIQPGDTLIGISTRQYGNDSYVQAICELNGISNPDNIQIGQKILLP